MTPTRQQIIEAARSYRNTPFRTAGRNRRGIDCIGVPLCVARDVSARGWELLWRDPDLNAYPRVRGRGIMRAKFTALCEQGLLRRIERNLVEPGDLVLRLGGFGMGHDYHVCLLSKPDMMIEASNMPEAEFPYGRVVEVTITPQVRRTFMAGYQFADVV